MFFIARHPKIHVLNYIIFNELFYINMLETKAKNVFKGLSLLFSMLAIFLFVPGIFIMTDVQIPSASYLLISMGGILFLLALLGPVRVSLRAGHMPQEIITTVTIVAVCLPICGLFMLFGGLITHTWFRVASYFISGTSLLVIAYFAFYKLSLTLPDKFLMNEMINIIKSSNAFGKKGESLPDREFIYWTKGIRNGAKLKQSAPDGMIYTLDGQQQMLSEWIESNASKTPLVVNFGSYTCPHHRKRIDQLHQLMDKWQDKSVNFLTIYTAEAHPEDGWRLENQYINDEEYTGNTDDFCFYQARTIEQRITMAKWLCDKKQFRMPIVIDSMENTLLKSYNSWPIRLYILSLGKVVYCGKQGPFGYEPFDLNHILEQLTSQ
jgi:thiol-disulfide isomerase/thioredoxin